MCPNSKMAKIYQKAAYGTEVRVCAVSPKEQNES